MKTNRAKSIKGHVVMAALLAWPIHACAGPTYVLPPEIWEQPRSARALLEQPDLRRSVSAWLSKPGSFLVIHHGSGEDALLRAEEVRAWLIALAVEATAIDLAGDLPGNHELRIELMTKRGQQ